MHVFLFSLVAATIIMISHKNGQMYALIETFQLNLSQSIVLDYNYIMGQRINSRCFEIWKESYWLNIWKKVIKLRASLYTEKLNSSIRKKKEKITQIPKRAKQLTTPSIKRAPPKIPKGLTSKCDCATGHPNITKQNSTNATRIGCKARTEQVSDFSSAYKLLGA